MKKKITILVTGIFITVAAISGCGSDPTNKTETPKAEATTRLDLSSESTHSNINWKEHPLLSKLPDPNTQKVKIESEDSSSINLYISDVSQGLVNMPTCVKIVVLMLIFHIQTTFSLPVLPTDMI